MRPTALAVVVWLAALASAGAATPTPAPAQAPPAVHSSEPAQNVRDDAEQQARWFYFTLTGEIAARTGHPGQAYVELLRAARDMDSALLFERVIQVSLDAGQPQQALDAVQAWQDSQPDSLPAQAWRVQLLLGLGGHATQAAQATARLLAMTPEPQRPQAILALGGVFEGMRDPLRALALARRSLAPYAGLAQSQVVIGHLQVLAGQVTAGVARSAAALRADPSLRPAAMILLQHYRVDPMRADSLLQGYFTARPDDDSLRMIWIDAATQAQRDSIALQQGQALALRRPDFAQLWLILGSLQQELGQPRQAERDLQRFLRLSLPEGAAPAASAPAPAASAPVSAPPAPQELQQIYVALSSVALQQGQNGRARQWLQRIAPDQRGTVAVALQQARILVAEGRSAAALRLVRQLPQRDAGQRRQRLLALASLLQDMHQPRRAWRTLEAEMPAWGSDPDYAYETAMAADKAGQRARMQQILRGIVQAHPRYQPALNALGYTLAEQGVDLRQARLLVRRALRLTPGNPFVLDSLGWVEFRLGRLPRAQQLLEQAYAGRNDPEIAAHLAEVLWFRGQTTRASALLRGAWRAAPHDRQVLRAMRRLGLKF